MRRLKTGGGKLSERSKFRIGRPCSTYLPSCGSSLGPGTSDDNAEPPFGRKIGEEQGFFTPTRGALSKGRDGVFVGGVSEVIGAIRIPTRWPIMCAKNAYLDMGGCMLRHNTCEIWTHP